MAGPNDDDFTPSLGELFEMGIAAPLPDAIGQNADVDSMIKLMPSQVGLMPPMGRGLADDLADATVPGRAAAAQAGGSPLADLLSSAAEAMGFPGAGRTGVASAEPLGQGRIAQRRPTAVSAQEDPLRDNLLINTNVMRMQPQNLEDAANILLSYPGFNSDRMREMYPDQRIEAATDLMSGNLLHLYNLMPPDARERAGMWYPGANRITLERARETGFHPYAMAGNYAALSPQKDWFQNVYLGDKVARAVAEDMRLSDNIVGAAPPFFSKPASVNAKTGKVTPAVTDQDVLDMLAPYYGKRLSEMPPEIAAMVVRLEDEVANPRKPYARITPEGDYGPMTGGSAAWQNTLNIAKAIAALRSGGDVDKLSALMGDKHKVRNFYNNIVAPYFGQRFGDITADTHQIAASLLRPLGASNIEVKHGLGSGVTSAITGLKGLYPLYADATRKASEAAGVPVRAMQSVPWEAVRSLFPAKFKTEKNQGRIDAIWSAYERGEIDANQARDAVVEAAGGFRPPNW